MFCAGCGITHEIGTPTTRVVMLDFINPENGKVVPIWICHSIKHGDKIIYFRDCSHKYAGTNLPYIPK